MANENFAVLGRAQIVDPPPSAPNVISFSYDNAGNQTRRIMIYLPPPLPRTTNPNTTIEPRVAMTKEIAEDKLLPSDLYEEIQYYPNPVKSELYVKWSEIDNNDLQTIELYDLNGRLMQSYPNQSNQENATIDFENYPAGYYNLMLLYSTGEPKSLKIVKQ
jgi:Secretion system C-terminal sorting domain